MCLAYCALDKTPLTTCLTHRVHPGGTRDVFVCEQVIFQCCVFSVVILRNFNFRIRDVQNYGLETKFRVQFLKLQKDYSFSNMVFKTRKTVIVKYLIAFKKPGYFHITTMPF